MSNLNEKKLKVMIFMTDLNDLGAQRVVINLYNNLNQDLIDSTLVLWRKEGKLANFLHGNGKVLETDGRFSFLRPRFIFRLFKYLYFVYKQKPDVILSIVPVTNVSISLIKPFIFKKIRFIACEHAYISKALDSNEYHGLFLYLYRFMIKSMYNNIADRLIMVANAAKDDAIKNFGIKENKITVIYNPQNIKDIREFAMANLDDEWLNDKSKVVFIAAGRLVEQKGFDKLIEAFSKVLKMKDSYLMILGDGKLKPKLMEIVRYLDLEKNVKFLGFQMNPLKYISRANVFVLSSIWEAMPMVLAETMLVGTPIVSFDCFSGPREMLDNGECGFLVDDQNVDALARAMLYAVDHPNEALSKAQSAMKRAEMFDVDKIIIEYQNELLGFSVVG